MSVILAVPELPVPEAEILQQANGSTSDAMRLAAAYGYGMACRDLVAATTAVPAALPEVTP